MSLGSPLGWPCGMWGGAPYPCGVAKAVESFGSPLGVASELRTPQGVSIAQRPILCATGGAACPCVVEDQVGVIGLTSWVVLCNEDWCTMPLRYGRGCGVIGITSGVPLRTSLLCVCWSDTGLLHEIRQFIQHRQTPIIAPCPQPLLNPMKEGCHVHPKRATKGPLQEPQRNLTTVRAPPKCQVDGSVLPCLAPMHIPLLRLQGVGHKVLH